MNGIGRAWEDEAYCRSLWSEKQAMPFASPTGKIELTDAELEAVCGAGSQSSVPVSDRCLESILIGTGRCKTLS